MTNEKKIHSSTENDILLSRAGVEHELRTRAYKDDAFRQALQEDPQAVLEREYPQWFPNGKIPDGLSIKVIEDEEQTMNLVLLPRKSSTTSTLAEEDLASIQGGGAVGGALKGSIRKLKADNTRDWGCRTDFTCSGSTCTHISCATNSSVTTFCR